jgi:hypothetical protein
MQLKITVAALLVIALLALTPGVRADPIQIPVKIALDRAATITSVIAMSETTFHSFTNDHDWDKDADKDVDGDHRVPEASSAVPLILLAAFVLPQTLDHRSIELPFCANASPAL